MSELEKKELFDVEVNKLSSWDFVEYVLYYKDNIKEEQNGNTIYDK